MTRSRRLRRCSSPATRGAPNVPVARIPVVRRPGTGDIAALVEDYVRGSSAVRRSPRGRVAAGRHPRAHRLSGRDRRRPARPRARDPGRCHRARKHDRDRTGRPRCVGSLSNIAGARRPAARGESAGCSNGSPGFSARLAADIEVIPNPVDDSSFPAADPAGRDPDELLWVGSLGEHKGIELPWFALRARTPARPRPRVHLRPGRWRTDRGRRRALAITSPRSSGSARPWSSTAGSSDRLSPGRWLGRGVFVHPKPVGDLRRRGG